MKRLASVLFSVLLVVVMLGACAPAPAAQPAAPAQPAATQPAAQPAAQQAAPAKAKLTIGTVVKLQHPWFDRLNEGVKRYAKDTGNNAFMQGPDKADPALQVQMLEDLIAQKPDAIGCVPTSAETVEPVLKKAMDAGIVVITHEAAGEKNVNWDVEAFDNASYGRHILDNLAKAMGEEGEWAAFVGHFTAKSHNEWVDAAVEYQKTKYPKMKFIEKLESNEEQEVAYQKTKELLKAHPNIKGFQGSSGNDAPGAARAVEELGLVGKVHVVGTSLPSVSGKYLQSGSIDVINFWDPADAGYVMNKLAEMVKAGQQPTEGMNLGAPGYEKIHIDGKNIYGNAWVDVTKANMGEYKF